MSLWVDIKASLPSDYEVVEVQGEDCFGDYSMRARLRKGKWQHYISLTKTSGYWTSYGKYREIKTWRHLE